MSVEIYQTKQDLPEQEIAGGAPDLANTQRYEEGVHSSEHSKNFSDKLASLGGELLVNKDSSLDAQRTNLAWNTKEAGNNIGFISLPAIFVDNSSKQIQLTSRSDKILLAQASDLSLSPKESYEAAQERYKKSLDAYWSKVDTVRESRRVDKTNNYVIEQPPKYDGPEKPEEIKEAEKVKKASTLANVDEMLAISKGLLRFAYGNDKLPDFNIREVKEVDFKSLYAGELLDKFGKDFKLSFNQIQNIAQGVYAFENGGWGTRETLANTPRKLAEELPGEPDVHKAERRQWRPNSTAIGYNQLLAPNTLSNLSYKDSNETLVSRLLEKAKEPGLGSDRVKELEDKAALVRAIRPVLNKELTKFANAEIAKISEKEKASGVDAKTNSAVAKAQERYFKNGDPFWYAFLDFAKSKQIGDSGLSGEQLSAGIHALNMDSDIGPILQSQELANKTKAAYKDKILDSLAQKAKEFESRASVYDQISSPERKKAAIAELMKHIEEDDESGQSSSSSKKNKASSKIKSELSNTEIPQTATDAQNKEELAAKLLNLKPGLENNLLTNDKDNDSSKRLIQDILKIKRYGEETGPLSNDARALLDKISYVYHKGPTAEDLLPAAIALYNLAGPGSASQMFKPETANVATANFFARAGYERNPVVNGRTVDELLMYIHGDMHGPNADPKIRSGQAQFRNVFKAKNVRDNTYR